MISIRRASEADYEAIWKIFHEVVQAQDSYAFPPDYSREDALGYWCQPSAATYVAEIDGEVLGSYMIRPNQPGLGSHVANAGYMVSARARGTGIGRLMGEHSLSEARSLGYLALQFNFVVSTNDVAVRLWLSLGFEIVGTLPRAFRHVDKGLVDAYVMFQTL